MRSLYSLLVSKHLNMLETGFTIMCCQLLVSSEKERHRKNTFKATLSNVVRDV